MAGRGPAPKDSSTRARRNKPPSADRVIEIRPTERPELPPTFPVLVQHGFTTVREDWEWPERTRQWWQMWADSPLSAEFTSTDWSELMDTALLHARYWSGHHGAAPELRLRVAKFGATPEDRARLRIQFAVADETEAKASKRKPESAPKGKKPAADPRLQLVQ